MKTIKKEKNDRKLRRKWKRMMKRINTERNKEDKTRTEEKY
jgi:hypothetical protein